MHFTLNDFVKAIHSNRRWARGSWTYSWFLPKLATAFKRTAEEEQCERQLLAIIDSMTRRERLNPEIVRSSEADRIARGSGTSRKDVREFVGQFLQMRKWMDRRGNGGCGPSCSSSR